jgi:hypothetical protein
MPILKYNEVPIVTVLCGCEICSPTSREEHRVRMSEKMALRRILGSMSKIKRKPENYVLKRSLQPVFFMKYYVIDKPEGKRLLGRWRIILK